MVKFDDKINGNTVDANEYNNIVRASKNAIEDSGQTIDATNTQLSEAIANYTGSANFYTDSGVADAYVLSTTGSFQAPTALVDGLEVRFRTSNANTGASTINVAGLGLKDVKRADGITDVAPGELPNDQDIKLRYDSTNLVFILLSADNIPMFSAYIGSVQTITTSTLTKVQFDTESFDTNSWYDSSTNYRFTPLKAGKYLVIGRIIYNNNNTGEKNLYIHKNGSVASFTNNYSVSPAIPSTLVNSLIDMNGTTDYLELFTFQTTGANADTNIGSVGTEFSAIYKGV